MMGRSRWDDLIRSSAPELTNESVNVLRNPTEFISGLGYGALKSIPDTFVYPTLLGGAVAGKLGSAAGQLAQSGNIPFAKEFSQGSTNLARNSLKLLEDYENAAQKSGTKISKSVGAEDVDNEESQKALRIGLTAGSFINPINAAKKFAPQLGAASGITGSILDFLEGGAIGAATKGVSQTQKYVGEPLTKATAKVASPLIDPILKVGAKATDITKKNLPKDIISRGIEAHFNPRMDTERIQAAIPDFFPQISDKLKHPVVSLEDIGDVLSTRGVKEHDLHNWVDSLTLPKTERSFAQIVSEAKVTGSKADLDNALNTIFENDPKKKVLANKLIDSGNIDKVEKLDPSFGMKYDIWKKSLPEDMSNVLTFGEEELPLIKSGIVGGYLKGIKKVDPIKNIATVSQKVEESAFDLSKAQQEALQKDQVLQSQWDAYNKTIADTIQNAKLKRVEYKQRIPELEKQSKESINALKEYQKQIYESNPIEVEQLQKQVTEHENALKSYKENLKRTPEEIQDLKKQIADNENILKNYQEKLKTTPEQKLALKKEYLQAKKEYNNFLKTEENEVQGQLSLEGVGSIRQQKLQELEAKFKEAEKNFKNIGKPSETDLQKIQELQSNINTAKEQYKTGGKPTEIDLQKAEQIKAALEDAKNRLKTYSRVPTPEEIQKLAELEQQAQQSYDQFIGTKDEFSQFLQYTRNQVKATKNERIQFKNSLFGDLEEDLSRKNWNSAKNKVLEGYKDNIKYHENIKNTFEGELAKLKTEPYEARYNFLQNSLKWGSQEEKTAAKTRFLEGAANELFRKQDDIYDAFHTGDKNIIKQAQEGLYNQKTKTLKDIANLTGATDEDKKLLANDYINNFDFTLASLFTKNVMYQKLEPAAGQMFQIISALPPVRASELEKVGMPYGEYLKRSIKAADYRKSKYEFFDNALYKPNRTVSDAFGLGTNLDDLALKEVDRGLVKNAISKLAPNKSMQIINKVADIVGFSAVEGAKKTNIDMVFDDAFAIASWMAERQKIPIGSKQFDDLVVKQTDHLLKRVGEKSFNASYAYKAGADGYKATQNVEERLNSWLGSQYGREAKDVATTLLGWISSAYHSILQSYNQVGDAFERVRKSGNITQSDREAVVRYVGDVVTNGILFGARGAGKVPLGLVETNPEAKLQENKYTLPMNIANGLLSFLPNASDDTKVKVLEGILGSKSEMDGSGGFGTTFERQKTLPIWAGFGGVNIITSVLQGSAKSSAKIAELMRKDPENFGKNLGIAVADSLLSSALYRKDVVNLGESLAEGTIKDVMGAPITPELGSPSRLEIGVTAGLKNKPASFSIQNAGFTDIQQRNRKLEDMYSDIPYEDFLKSNGPKRFLKSAIDLGYDPKNPEARKKIIEVLNKTMQQQQYPKFISKKFKKLDTIANAVDMTSDDYIEKKRILESVSQEEAADLLAMSIIVGGKKQSKMINFLLSNKLIDMSDKDKLTTTLKRTKKFLNVHKKQVTPKMQSFFDSLNEEPEQESFEEEPD